MGCIALLLGCGGAPDAQRGAAGAQVEAPDPPRGEGPRVEAGPGPGVDGGRGAELDGSWFVRYASDPKPYLDVAFRGGPQPSRVTVDLQGPERAWVDLELALNEGEGEWQVVCSFLPQPLAGGPWFVSAVRAWHGAERTEYRSSAPWEPYAVWLGSESRASEVTPGFFYATEPGPLPWRIETMRPPEGRVADPILRVYREGELRRWVAANDDPDVDQPYPSVVLPVEPGGTYLIALSGAEDDGGDYLLRAGPAAEAAGPPADALPRERSPAASQLPPSTWVRGTLGREGVDWYRVTVPP